MREALIVILALFGGAILTAIWVWQVVFKKSLRKMVFTFVGILLNRDVRVDPNAPIEPLRDEPLSHVLDEKAKQLSFEERVARDRPPEPPPKAIIPPNERGEAARDTSDSGWPRILDPETRRDQRPFREIHLRTENEETHAILDVDTFVESEDEGKQEKEQEDQ